MIIQQLEKNGTHIAWIPEKELLITDVQGALDLAATVKYETGCTSKPLHDFIYESNHGRSFFFVPTKEEAIEKLCQ